MQSHTRAATLAAALLAAAWTAAPATAARAQDSTAAAAARPLDDTTVAAILDAANTWDMEAGQLGQRRGSTKAVRAFARMMIRDHQQIRQQGRTLVKRLGIRPTPSADSSMRVDHRAAMARLRKLNGRAFDSAYVANEIAYHRSVISAVSNTLLPATQNDELRQFQVKVTPTFQAHLAAAERLQQQVAVK